MLVSSPPPKGQIVTHQKPQTAPAAPPPEVIEVETAVVACDGGGGTLGHPRVFLNLADGEAECGYCDRRYVLKPGAKAAHGH